MKRRLIEFLIIIFFICSKSYALPPECIQLFKEIKSQSEQSDLYNVPVTQFLDFGFEFKYIYNKEEESWVLDRSKDGYLSVGRITDKSVVNKVKDGDVVLKINEKDTNLFKNEDDLESYIEDHEDFTLEIKRRDKKEKKDEIFQLALPKLDRWIEDEKVDLDIRSINKVDIKNSTFEVLMTTLVTHQFRLDVADFLIAKLALDNLIYSDPETEHLPDNEKKWLASSCKGMSVDKFEELNLYVPGQSITLRNLTQINRNMIKETINIIPFSTKKGVDDEDDYLWIEGEETTGTYTFLNEFELKTFPFDKQHLIIPYQSSGGMNRHNFYLDEYTIMSADFFVNNSSIEGWEILGYKINENLVFDRFGATTGQNLEIIIERKHGYYLYKVLIPIILILMICWSVVWIDPKELESRLTITIVCLLSLIAYNFVIDSELPKLEYLTVLDLVILTSYFYATIPNFLTIISFNLSKTDPERCKRYEQYAKMYGPTSYILAVLLIIFFRVATNLDHSAASVAWMFPR